MENSVTCQCGNIISEYEFSCEHRCNSTQIWWCYECGAIAYGYDEESPRTNEFILTKKYIKGENVEFKKYRKTGFAEMRPYVPGEDLTHISVSEQDDPKPGDMIAREPTNHKSQWLISQEFFERNYEPI